MQTSFRPRRALAGALISGALLASLAVTVVPVAANDRDALLPVTHDKLSPLDPIFASGAQIGAVGTRVVPNPVCTTGTSSAANRNTDCEGVAPSNETSLAVNPTNAQNMIGGANDYQLSLSPGGIVYETIYSRAHVTFDGGNTWKEWKLTNQNAYTSTGDPAVAFDTSGRAYYATLGFTWSQNRFCCTNPDVVVETSTDGGKHWSAASRVAMGSGVFTSPGRFNDKEYITAWGNGNAIVTWTVFNDGLGGSYISSPIYDSVTHDGGATWTVPHQISGFAAFCVGAQGGTACNQDQFSTPVVAADGSIYVSFVNFAEPTTTGRDQYLVVKVDPVTGQRIAGPYEVGLIFDGFTDYPINEDFRQTLQDSEFRTNAAGNIAADPTAAGHLVVAWSDMRNSTLPAPADPYSATTNSDVIWSESTNGGATWSTPAAIATPKDQFQPWSVFDSSGNLWIGTFDREFDSANHLYGYSLSENGGAFNQLTTALSDPTTGDRWFSGRSPNANFPNPTSFLGDYSGIATDGTNVYGYWTDMRRSVTWPSPNGRTGWGEDAEFGR